MDIISGLPSPYEKDYQEIADSTESDAGLDKRVQRIARTSKDLELEPDETGESVFTNTSYQRIEKWLTRVNCLCTDLTHSKERNSDLAQTALVACKEKIDQLRDQLLKARALGVVDEHSGQVETHLEKTERLLAEAIIDWEEPYTLHSEKLERSLEGLHDEWPLDQSLHPVIDYSLPSYRNALSSLKQLTDSYQKLSPKQRVASTFKQDLEMVREARESFRTVILPAMRQDLKKAQKAFQQASQNLQRAKGDGPALLKAYRDFEESLARVRFLESGLQTSILSLGEGVEQLGKDVDPSLHKALKEDQIALSQMLWEAGVKGSQIEQGRAHFAKLNPKGLQAVLSMEDQIEKRHRSKLIEFRKHLVIQREAREREIGQSPPAWKSRMYQALFLALQVSQASGTKVATDSLQTALQQVPSDIRQEAHFIGEALSGKYQEMRAMSGEEFAEFTADRPPEVLEILESYRQKGARSEAPSDAEIFALQEGYVSTSLTPEASQSLRQAIREPVVAKPSQQEIMAKLQEALQNKDLDGIKQHLMAIDNVKGLTPKELRGLFEAIIDADDADLMDQLLKKGGDPNMKVFTFNPLNWVVKADKPKLLELMIQAGGSVATLREPLYWAGLNGASAETLALLVKAGRSINEKSTEGSTPLLAAIESGNIETARALLALGADPNLTGSWGDGGGSYAPLDRAIRYMDLLVPDLIKTGASVDDIGGYWRSPLAMAAAFGKTDAIRHLLTAKVNVNFANAEGQTPLHLSSSSEITQELLRAGADPDIQDNQGKTPLHIAVERNFISLAVTLLHAGASVGVSDFSGKTVLDVGGDRYPDSDDPAKHLSWRLLLDKDSRKDTEVLRKGFQSIEDEVLLVYLVEDLDLMAVAKVSSLSQMVERGKIGVLPALVKKQADINHQDKNGCTALHWACRMGLEGVAEFLWNQGADPNLVDDLGLTPLDVLKEAGHGMRHLLAKIDPKAKVSESDELFRREIGRTQALLASPLPDSLKTKLVGSEIHRGVSTLSVVYTVPSARGEEDVAKITEPTSLVLPLALRKTDTTAEVRDGTRSVLGTLHDRCGYVTGVYFDELLVKQPVTGLTSFRLPEVFTQAREERTDAPSSYIRFAHASKDMMELSPQDIGEVPTHQWAKLVIFDVLLGNLDRHTGNVRFRRVLQEDGEMSWEAIPIDHDNILPNLKSFDEFRMDYRDYVDDQPFSTEWQSFIEAIDGDALWDIYVKEAESFEKIFKTYVKGESAITDDHYLGFMARLNILKKEAEKGVSMRALVTFMTEGQTYGEMFKDDDPKAPRDERLAKVMKNIEKHFEGVKV